MNDASTTRESGRRRAHPWAPAVTWASVAVTAASVAFVARQVPVGQAVEALRGWVEGLGWWGPVAFGLVYVAASLLLLPAWALTVAAGAIFGLLPGMLVVSCASTVAAALAMLVSRYLARRWVERLARRYPKFRALDRAVSEGGWRVVVLLRLSPAVPFTLQNYLYGLTGIGFWPCVLASWAAMLPGTFMYVYLGAAGRAGLEAAGGRTRTPGEWALLTVGLLATVAVTVYVTRLARRALRQQTDIPETDDTAPEQAGWPWGATVAAAVALASLAVAVYVQFRPEVVRGLFG